MHGSNNEPKTITLSVPKNRTGGGESRRLNDTIRSNYEEANEHFQTGLEFLSTIKEQLVSKNLTFINDDFTREIFTQMSRSKKKIVTCRLRGPIQLNDKSEVEVEEKPYFKETCTTHYIHYFQPYTKYLHLFNLKRPFDIVHNKIKKIRLNIDFDISPHCKSVITPSGLIYLVSGRVDDNPVGLDDSSGSLHVYHYDAETLLEKSPMIATRRRQFGLCYMSKNLFVVGGYVNGIVSNHCERYDIRSNEWLEIAPMPKKLREVSICAFNNRYIYRFFGLTAQGYIDTSIDRYDAVRDKWVSINLKDPAGALKEVYLPLCTQINQESIFIFGGKNIFGYSTQYPKGYVLKIEDKRGSTTAELSETAGLNPGFVGTFNQNHIISHNGDILFLRESNTFLFLN